MIERLGEAFREQSRATILMHQAIAQKVGLSAGESKCVDLLLAAGPLTAGEIARECGITTGAVTGILDRLEAAGFARRERDPADRRRVIVQVELGTVMRQLAPYYRDLGPAAAAMLADYTDAELELLLAFTRRCIEFAQTQTQRVKVMKRGR